ncbi:MAG: glycosyltransferase family 39 protein [Anaerolineae bacterium]|nr:glycosyltransferase family 39 protein [Anaerolineae bacterium]
MLAACAGLAFVLRVVGLDAESLWRDEIDAIRFAYWPLAELFETFTRPGHNGPLYYLLLRPWLEVAGRSGFALRFFSLSFGVLSVPMMYRLARRLFPRWPSVALLSAVLAAISPYLVWYGQEGKMYALVVVLALLSMDRYLAALERGGWSRWLLYLAATSAAVYVHLVAALIIPVQVIGFFALDRQAQQARWKPAAASLAALTLPYVPLLVWQVPLLLNGGETGYRFVPLHKMLVSLLGSYSLGVVQPSAPWFLVLFGALLLSSVLAWKLPGARQASLFLLWAWLLVPVAAFFLVTLLRPMYTARYLIFVMPAYLLLLAVAVRAAAGHSRLIAALVLVMLAATSGWGIWLQGQNQLKADFRAATRYVAARWEREDLILFQIPYGRYSFEYYWPEHLPERDEVSMDLDARFRVFLPTVSGGGAVPYRWAEGLYTNDGMSLAEADRRMADLAAGSRTVWLVATETALWDERGLVQAWLEEHGSHVDEAHFVRVDIVRYELP